VFSRIFEQARRAARRLLSSKPKPGKSKKVPKHPEKFRHFGRTISNFAQDCTGFASSNSSGRLEMEPMPRM
jgi:hypothetical protein